MSKFSQDLANAALLKSAETLDFAGVQEAVKKGANLNKYDKNGDTALIFAARGGHEKIFNFLVGQGAAADFPNEFGNDALMESIISGKAQFAQKSLSTAFNTARENHKGETALLLAAKHDMPALIPPLVANGYAVDQRDQSGATALMLAELAGDTKTFRYFLAREDVDLEAEDHDGRTVLMRALSAGHRDTADALLKAGAYVNHSDNRGRDVMLIARQHDMEDLVKAAFENYDIKRLTEGTTRGVTVLKRIHLKHMPPAA